METPWSLRCFQESDPSSPSYPWECGPNPLAFGELMAQWSCLRITSNPQAGWKSQGYCLGDRAPLRLWPSLGPEKVLQRHRHPDLFPLAFLFQDPCVCLTSGPAIYQQQDLQIHSAHSWHPPPHPCHHGNLSLSQPAAPSSGIYSCLLIGLLAALLPPSLFSCSS